MDAVKVNRATDGFPRPHDVPRDSRPTNVPSRASRSRDRLELRHVIAIAIGSYALALLGTVALWQPLFKQVPFALFFAAVAVTAWFGGLLPGVLVVFGGIAACGVLMRESGMRVVPPSVVLVGVGCLICYLAERFRQSDRNLRQSEGRLRAILDTAVDSIVTIDERGTVSSLNPAAVRLFGYAPDEVVGRNVTLLMPSPYREEHDVYLTNYRETGVRKIIGIGREVIGRKKDGTTFPMDLAVSETTLPGGQRFFTGIVRDISERKRAEESLARQAEQLARSNVELERFAYVASHDLQEPMRTVHSFAQLLERRCEGQLSDDAKEYLRFIADGAQRMRSLINDLLAYSRVSSQGAVFAPVDCALVMSRVLENLKASIDGHHADVQVQALPTVVGDATQLGQLFQNLLVNAMKFHGERPPQIRVSAAEQRGEWQFAVSDNGIGIAPEYFERIFIIFQRLHTIEEYAGTGIGLSICKKIVERHGGRIWVESTPGEGSTFHFSVPKRERSRNEP